MNRFLADSIILIVAYFAAFLLRFDFATPSFGWRAVWMGVPSVLIIGWSALAVWGCTHLRSATVTLRNLPCFAQAVGTLCACQLLLRLIWNTPDMVWLRPPISVTLMAGVLTLLGLLALRYVSRLQLRPIEVADLLGRDETEVNTPRVQMALAGKTILITGAGGSIGGELARQVLLAAPKRLILLDISEAALYTLHDTLQTSPFADRLLPIVGNCGERAWIHQILLNEKPDMVLHAAAYKHVPMMECNPCAALKNNALATRVLAEVTASCGIERFVLISTDKAIRPISVMGITKRLAELFTLDLTHCSSTIFCAVRFGNVLDSSGSAVPKFRRQIQQGGPLTITDPRMKRYFMTIPEAAGLVLQAATFAQGGEIFVLDMGQAVSITHLAEMMIRRTGLTPGKDIPIVYTGIRPGEKLEESLDLDAPTTSRTDHQRIFVNRLPCMPTQKVHTLLTACKRLATQEGNLTATQLKALLNNEGVEA